MKMNLVKDVMARVAGTVAVVLLGAGVFASPDVSAGIANTKHNLGSSAGPASRVNSFSGTGEICVFCHTPHGSDTSASVPLWNRVLSSPTIYTTYNSLGTSSLDGSTAPVGSVSLACLSCHDGTQAMNVMINQPGSGGYNSAGGPLAGSWGTSADQTNGMISDGLITMIGKDLRNDHPIGIQYAGGPKSGTVAAAPADYTNTSFRDADFNSAKSAVLNGQSVWWVDTSVGTAGSREKTDMQLYTRTDVTSVNKDGSGNTMTLSGAQPYVECASCHDPHTENTTFLRIPNTASAVCLACHTK